MTKMLILRDNDYELVIGALKHAHRSMLLSMSNTFYEEQFLDSSDKVRAAVSRSADRYGNLIKRIQRMCGKVEKTSTR